MAIAGFLIVFPHVPIVEIQKTMFEMRKKLSAGGPSAFTNREKLAIYGSNLVMGLGGLVAGYPEVALETWLLTIPSDGTRTWHSDFAMESKKVRERVGKFARKLKRLPQSTKEYHFNETHIAWTDYVSDSPRVSLALNKLTLKADAVREGNLWRIVLHGAVNIEYPLKSWVKLFKFAGHTFYVEEGLFGAIQKTGWLFPYKGHWLWTVYSDDPRIQ